MSENIPKRPAWNHQPIIEAAAATIVDDVHKWADVSGCIGDDDADIKQFRALVTIAILESPDAYQAGRYLEDFYGWPVDRPLISVLDRAFRQMPLLVPEHVHAWVMKYNVRFPATKGQGVRVNLGGCEFTGTVVDVIAKDARAIVIPIGKSQQPISIPAEEVIESFTIKPPKGEQDSPPDGDIA